MSEIHEIGQNYNCPCIHPSQCDDSCFRPSFFGCINCGKAMSIGEVIERHCDTCNMHMKPFEVRARHD